MSGVALQSVPNGEQTDQFGNAQAGKRFYVYLRNTSTQIQVYTDDTLTTPYPQTQPLTTQADGSLPGYADPTAPWDYVDAATGNRVQGATGILQLAPRSVAINAGDGVSVTTSSGAASAVNANRAGLILTNDDATAIVYGKLGSAAVLSQGFRINPNGGRWATPDDTGGVVYTGIVYLIGTGSCTVARVEI